MQEWTAFLLHSSTVIFTGSIGLMLGLFVMEVLLTLVAGGGVGHLVDHAFGGAHPHVHVGPTGHATVGAHGDASTHAPDGGQAGGLFAWLQLGRVPFMIWLVVLLTSFGLIGLIGQGVIKDLLGHFLSPWLAAPLAFAASLPIVRTASKTLARLVPQEESSVVSEDHFLGREATVMLGVATATESAEAKLVDMYGRAHYVQVIPGDGSPGIPQGTRVTLMRQVSRGKFVVEPMLGTLPAPPSSLDLLATAARTPARPEEPPHAPTER